MDLESSVMELIVNSGQARSLAFEALAHARAGEFGKAEESLAASKEAGKAAHRIQTSLIEADEGEGKIPVTLVMVHAQDHLMTSMLAQDLIEEMVRIHQKL